MRNDMTRRSLLQSLAASLWAIAAGAIFGPVLRLLAAPLRASRRERPFLRVAPLSAVQPGRPFRATVFAERQDAFFRHPPGPVGTVWLIREEEDQKENQQGKEETEAAVHLPRVSALQSICPHLGCGIDFLDAQHAFLCPCHASRFALSGERLNRVSPRDMDELPCRISEPDDAGQRWVEVQYQEFQIGLAHRRPLA